MWPRLCPRGGWRPISTADAFGYPPDIKPRRVVVTGLGLVTPLGVGVARSWRRLVRGETAVRRLREADLPETHRSHLRRIPCQVAACVPKEELETCEWAPKKESRQTAAFMHYAMVAAAEALADATWIPQTSQHRMSTGVAVGSGMSCTEDMANAGMLMSADSLRRLGPFFVPRVLPNMAAGCIGVRYGLHGPNLAPSTACAAGSHAIGDAFHMIQKGAAKVMVAGGSEACIDAVTLMGFCRLRALATKYNDNPLKASRPFDKERDGFVVGEGAGIVVLEELEHAQNRGARAYAEIRGYGVSGDGHHITQPHPTGLGASLAIMGALRNSGVNPEDVAYLNAHATSTPLGDDIEQRAIASAFGDWATKEPLPSSSAGQQHGKRSHPGLLVSSTKGATGHLLGASGAVELVFTVLSLTHRVAPATVNLTNPEPCLLAGLICQNSPKLKSSLPQHPFAAMSNSFGFGGTNSALLLTTPPF
ncbi:unnamed protein product [Ostreobium quekettii]|uniref:beta-ketoacyl-[acyl-carrier-protein] synthase I n=1 Tax=Ostreobium quekettii TaxID=121088 RepID=A0A8S1J6F2_9CHLO|nr:unnamed protein product [Ostreobium quekettii]